MKLTLVNMLKVAEIRRNQIVDASLECDILNDEYQELGKFIAIIRNLLKIEKAKDENKSAKSYKLYKLTNTKEKECATKQEA